MALAGARPREGSDDGEEEERNLMRWHLSHRADPRARVLADRHYNRQNPDSPHFVPPGSCLVLLTENADAVWVTLAPYAQYVRHRWAGAWTCTLFRREPECPHLASDLVRDAVAATRWKYGDPPEQGFITFVDRDQTRPKRDPGYCYRMAGWTTAGRTKGGLHALHLDPAATAPEAPLPMIHIAGQLTLT